MNRKRWESLLIQEDEDYIWLNKPSGISSLHERDLEEASMLSYIRSYMGDYQLCHRLDKETSGLLLVAKHPAAYRHASMAFEHRKLEKVYHAVVHGTHRFENKLIELPLVTTRNGRAQINSLKGKESSTLINSLELFKDFTLIEAKPTTGRLHQIRIHLSSQRAPIVGDPVYGGSYPFLSQMKSNYHSSKFKEEQAMIKRVALHALSLEFVDMAGKKRKVSADYPKDLEVFIKQIRKYNN